MLMKFINIGNMNLNHNIEFRIDFQRMVLTQFLMSSSNTDITENRTKQKRKYFKDL